MARVVLPRVNIYSLALFVSVFHRASSSTWSPVDCTRFDIAELEDYLSKVHPEEPATTDTMIGKFASTVTTEPPFGALKSDWPRLLLLQRAQPEGSILREKLGRLFRILAVAYTETVLPTDITEPAVFSASSRWYAFSNKNTVNFAKDSTETTKIAPTSTALPDLEESSRSTEIELPGPATSLTTKSYIRFESSTLTDTVAPSPFDTNTFATIARFTTRTSSDRKSVQNLNTFVKNDDPAGNNIDEDPWRTKLSPIATTSAFDGTTAIARSAEAERNSKVVATNENRADDPANKRRGIKMTDEKDGRPVHFRGAERIGGFVAGKSSVAGTVEEEDARPITSPVSAADTPFTPVGSDFSASRIQDHGPMNAGLAEGIKELGSVGTASTEIASADPGSARGALDSGAAVYTLMNSEDQENTAGNREDGYRGVSVNTSEPVMSRVKTTIGRSRVHTDRIPANEVSGLVNDFDGRPPVYHEDGGYTAPGTSPQSDQNSVVYRNEIRKASVTGRPRADNEFSSRAVIPRMVTSTIGSAGPDQPDQKRDNQFRTGRINSKKRGSLNTDLEKLFRRFYNAGAGEDRDSRQRGIRIECGGNDHGN